MNALIRLRGFLHERSRPRFHPAIDALLLGAFLFALLALVYGILRLLFEWLGWGRIVFNHEFTALVGGLICVAELVRGHLRAWLKLGPEQRSFFVTGIAGGVVGALFSADIALMWGDVSGIDFAITIAIGAAIWMFVDACLRWEARKETSGR